LPSSTNAPTRTLFNFTVQFVAHSPGPRHLISTFLAMQFTLLPADGGSGFHHDVGTYLP